MNSGEHNIARRHAAAWAGAGFWCLYCAAAVLLRGVRWEETWEHALVLTGAAPYPVGHPIQIYTRGLFTLQSYAQAALLEFTVAPALLCGIRNALALAAAALPAFALGTALTGRAAAGHAAAALTLLGIHAPFQSYYPITVWPAFFSNGQIGQGFALAAVAALCAGCRAGGAPPARAWLRAGAFLAGLLCAVHLGQVPAVAALAAAMLLHQIWRRDARGAIGMLLAGAAGLALAAAFALVFLSLQAFPRPAGPYAVQGGAWDIWRNYSALYDVHRAFPRYGPFALSAAAAAAALWLAIAGWRLESPAARPAQASLAPIAAYAAAVCALVGGIMTLHAARGFDLPFLLIGWMPYRLTNHLAALAIPAAIAVLYRGARNQPAAAALFLALLTAYGALAPALSAIAPAQIAERYIEAREAILFALCGGGAAAALRPGPRGMSLRSLALLAAPACAGWLAIAGFHRYGAACLLAGALLMTALLHWPLRAPSPRPGALLAAASLLLAGSIAFTEWRTREHLPRTPFQEAVNRALAHEHPAQDALILTPYWEIEWLARTRRPIMADYQTAHLMSYRPALAPVLRKMFHDLYRFDLEAPDPPGISAWKDRSEREWRQLAREYGFRYIAAPDSLSLPLEPVVSAEGHTLYRAW